MLGVPGNGSRDGRQMRERFTERRSGNDRAFANPCCAQLPTTFLANAGHEDHVVELPQDAVLLASSPRVPEQAFRFADKPIYCTQFHPELDRAAMIERLIAYPEYVARVARTSFDDFIHNCCDTPEANSLLQRFVELYFG